jgi:peptide deformylase
MARLKIVSEPDPRMGEVSDRLRQKSARVETFDGDLRQLAYDMLETMEARDGVGLAAPQVGILRRLVVITVPGDDEDDPPETYFLVNPEIMKAGGQETALEGCLSFPTGLYGEVRRYATVNVRARDLDGKEFRVKGRGLLARALQHEIDHLDGILFIDRMDDYSTLGYLGPETDGDPEDARPLATAQSPAE